jgi:hypothetical protein
MAKMKFREWYKFRYGREYEAERVAEIGGALLRMHESLAEWADLVAEGAIPESMIGASPSQQERK